MNLSEYKQSLMNIPEEMRQLNRWVVFRIEEQTQPDGSIKRNKVPYQACDWRWRAAKNNPEDWASFQEAFDSLGHTCEGMPPITAVGFVMGDGWAGVDLDAGPGHENSQDFSPETLADVHSTLKTYAEKSLSGNGYHFIGRYQGSGFDHTKNPDTGVEIYAANHFFVMTGNVWGDYRDPEDITESLRYIYTKYIAPHYAADTGSREHHSGIMSQGAQVEFYGDPNAKIPRSVWSNSHLLALYNGDEYWRKRIPDASNYDFTLMIELIREIGDNEALVIKTIRESPWGMNRSGNKPDHLL